jgi:translin
VDRGAEISAAGTAARTELEAKFRAREATLAASRQAIRTCAVAIRAVQRREFDDARRHIDEARALLDEAARATEHQLDVRYAGFLHDAQKEFAEANLTLALVAGTPMPSARELGVETPAYLNGMTEAASELRRQVLDCLRQGDLDRAESLFAAMDEVYGLMITVDYPEAMTGGLRRSTDALRAVLERTRGDVTNAVVAARFEAAVRPPDPDPA